MNTMKLHRSFRNTRGRQLGATLVETMISLALSMLVVVSMVGLMGNSMGSATRIIQMSQLTDEMRNAMSMMSRDVRRANYNTNAIYCYANSDCGTDGSATQSANLSITSGTDSCFLFGLDRNWDGNANNDGGGAFRKDTVTNAAGETVGVIEMWVGTTAPSCADNASWVPITDPDFVDITDFTLANGRSYSQDLELEGGSTLTQLTRVIEMSITGQLIIDRNIEREIRDMIRVRNDFYL